MRWTRPVWMDVALLHPEGGMKPVLWYESAPAWQQVEESLSACTSFSLRGSGLLWLCDALPCCGDSASLSTWRELQSQRWLVHCMPRTGPWHGGCLHECSQSQALGSACQLLSCSSCYASFALEEIWISCSLFCPDFLYQCVYISMYIYVGFFF